MRQLIYVIRDKVAEQNTPLFIVNNDGAAIRQYRQFVAELPPHTEVSDFLLFCVGVWDSQNMRILVNDDAGVFPTLINTDSTKSEAIDYVP